MTNLGKRQSDNKGETYFCGQDYTQGGIGVWIDDACCLNGCKNEKECDKYESTPNLPIGEGLDCWKEGEKLCAISISPNRAALFECVRKNGALKWEEKEDCSPCVCRNNNECEQKLIFALKN